MGVCLEACLLACLRDGVHACSFVCMCVFEYISMCVHVCLVSVYAKYACMCVFVGLRC